LDAQVFQKRSAIDRLSVLLDEVPRAKSPWSFLLGMRKSPYSDANFNVVNDRIFLRDPGSVEDPEVMFRLFKLIAGHNLTLAPNRKCGGSGGPQASQVD